MCLQVEPFCWAWQRPKAGRVKMLWHFFRLHSLAARLVFLTVAYLAATVFPAARVAQAQEGLQALLDKARVLEKAGDYAAAERVYDQALALDPANPEILKRLGVLEQTELKFADSIAHFGQVLSGDPAYPEVNFFLGVSYFGQNDYSSAIRSFERELQNR